ncbi:NAD(P)-binding protein [Salinispora arenicola]|uniref:FAD-dependent oxidoreductase n=1 Tax=Salinispora arenicola TaxID=168697 RepID=UPI00142F8902|nr:FAD-dependent monooxygenase [Salinispora arenicola]NIL43208.1 NAD(P)-binding protein [Salinispora arenicola]
MAGGRVHEVLISGAGVAGLAAAVALRSAGHRVRVYERSLDPSGDAGTAFNLWGNAMTALDRLGVGAAVRAAGDPLHRMRLLSHRGELIAENPIGEIGQRLGTESVNLRRAELMRLLREAANKAGAELRFGQAGRTCRTEGDRVVLGLADGSEVHGDVLVGADGARSTLRMQLTSDGGPQESSLPVRGISDVDPGAPANTVLMVWGPRGGGAGCWPLAGGQVSWTVGTTTALRRRMRRETDLKRLLLDFVAGFPEPIEAVIAATPAERMVVTPVLVHRDLSWGGGRVLLVGDAAHAMPTVYSQGACQALEDAVVLGEALTDTDDVLAGLADFRRRRTPRMEWLRGRVQSLDRMQKFENRLMCGIRDRMAGKAPPERSERSWRQIMDFGHVPQG